MNNLHLSLEVFPPKKQEDFPNAYSILDSLSGLNPEFISVTYGAGGSNSKKTVEIASYIQNTLHIPSVAHLTCVGNTKQDILHVVDELKKANVSRILALRGDRPASMSDEQFNAREFTYASDLVSFLKQETDFTLLGGCYPEKHFESPSMEEDLQHLKEKTQAGCGILISQLFFDNDYFYRFLEKAEKIGIKADFHAGIMPITTAKQLGTTVSLSGSSVPKKLADLIATYGDNAEDMRKAGIDFAIRQILDLNNHGISGIHLYSMNKPKTTAEIVNGIR